MNLYAEKVLNILSLRNPSKTRQQAVICGTAGIMITAGGACGFDCRRDRDIRDRDDMLKQIDEVLAKNIEDCNGDPACIEAEREKARNFRWGVNEWYIIQVNNNHNESREAREFLRNLLKELGKDAAETLKSLGSVTGQGQIIDVVSIAVASSPSSDTDDVNSDTDTGGVEEAEVSVTTVVQSVGDTVGNSTSGLVEADLVRHLQGSFSVNLVDDMLAEIGQYSFQFDFVIGRSRLISGLSVREISSGTANISSSDLVLVLNGDAGRSSLIIGNGGVGILRLSGEIVSSIDGGSNPFNQFIKIDLPVNVTNNIVHIQTNGVVDLNILVNDQNPWYVDYNEDGQLDAADRALFLLDHAAGEPWADLVGDEIIDAQDIARFDSEIADALARNQYLSGQGVGGN